MLDPVSASRRTDRSRITRMVELLVRRAVSCTCGGTRLIALVPDSDPHGDGAARLLRHRLHRVRHDVRVIIEPPDGDELIGASRTHRCVTLDLSNSSSLASLGFRWETLAQGRAGRGRLLVCAPGLDVTLGPGIGLCVRPCGDELAVESMQEDGSAGSRLSTTCGPVDVYDPAASHLLLRDEQLMADAPAHIRLTLDARGRVLRSV